ncbi:RTA1 like protein-domain-containing protein [Rhexocercosporidium sp. MPI-PUGE-AT-0058]|nr:RTA1 like protein-domain-containing protein [Rhexocercosporidium sp. MPI-PUGE-AT-0058]
MGQHYVAINCTSVSLPDCSIEDTVYGYRPNLGANSFFTVIFSILAIVHFGTAIRWKTWFFGIAIFCGCVGEAIGYGGRIIMNANPVCIPLLLCPRQPHPSTHPSLFPGFLLLPDLPQNISKPELTSPPPPQYDGTGFSIQISCLIFSPAFFAAAIYLTLKHIVLTFGSSKSRIPARMYAWIFISCDIISLLLQAIGGGMAGSADGDDKKLDLGTNLMIAGIVFQVATLIIFAGLVVDYVVRTRADWENVSESVKAVAATKNFKRFSWAVTVAFVGVFARSVYRIAEMATGWATPIMRDEPGFIVMEGFMILISVLTLTVFHPGYCFSQLSSQKNTGAANSSSSESGLEKGQNSGHVPSIDA